MKITKLSSLLKQQFLLHMSRIECLGSFILAIIECRPVNMAVLAQKFAGCQPESSYKRLQRFVKEISFKGTQLAYLIISILGIEKGGQWQLIFDRSNWKVGSKDINVLFLAVCYKGYAVPLFYTFLKDKKSGNSNYTDRILLMEKFIHTFGINRIGVLLGDREFIGHMWMKYLIRNKIPFCVRLKESWNKVALQNGDFLEVKKCFPDLQRGEQKSLGLCQLGQGKDSVDCFVTGMRAPAKGEWVTVAHSEGLKDPCSLYRQRWRIETMFKTMKTGGFNLEDTHLTRPERLECLLGVLAIAFVICHKAGQFIIAQKPPTLKKTAFGLKL